MFPPGEKSPWLQAAGEPRNPYYGSAMLACFDERVLIPTTPVDGASPAAPPTEETTVAEATDVEPMAAMPADMGAALTGVLRAYLVAADALADDTTRNLDTAAPALAEAAERLAAEAPTLNAEALVEAAAQLDTDDLSDARLALKAVSDVLYPLVADVGVPLTLDAQLIAARCPMFPPGEKSWWIQPAGDLRNPYYGSAMLACSDEQVDLPSVRVAAATEGAD
jgi:Cu(I)/Ag(I) efflux system membrane fusion protein